MEEGLKIDFDDLLRDDLAKEAVVPDMAVEPEVEPALPPGDAEQARSQLLAAVAALELPPVMSDEDAEALALAEAIEQERLEREE